MKDGFGGDFPPCREIAQIKGEIEEALRDKITINDLLEPAILKPFLIAITMYAILNLSGLNIMIFYCNTIFQYSGSSLNHNVASIIVAILLLISSFLAIIVIKVLPRKIILITSMGSFLPALFFLTLRPKALMAEALTLADKWGSISVQGRSAKL